MTTSICYESFELIYWFSEAQWDSLKLAHFLILIHTYVSPTVWDQHTPITTPTHQSQITNRRSTRPKVWTVPMNKNREPYADHGLRTYPKMFGPIFGLSLEIPLDFRRKLGLKKLVYVCMLTGLEISKNLKSHKEIYTNKGNLPSDFDDASIS